MELSQIQIKGKCQCGQVSCVLRKEPIKVVACHCQECQTLSTGPYSVTAVVDTDAIDFQGEMSQWSRIAESGNKNVAFFCPVCGNRIYHFDPAKPEFVRLKLKASRGLPDDRIFEPTHHIWIGEKQGWLELSDNKEAFIRSVV